MKAKEYSINEKNPGKSIGDGRRFSPKSLKSNAFAAPFQETAAGRLRRAAVSNV
ncbi:hypothetical protein IC234_11785 [Hymenobacter sp. BT189]|uniref:Uncharacterized protein n=1 Tax=Hymenobacter armeniacus TaxID=2771358 RepID=A0ABR8JXX8_9BACT|nr:hypothetical protein [Hymenobacter armeniacus]